MPNSLLEVSIYSIRTCAINADDVVGQRQLKEDAYSKIAAAIYLTEANDALVYSTYDYLVGLRGMQNVPALFFVCVLVRYLCSRFWMRIVFIWRD